MTCISALCPEVRGRRLGEFSWVILLKLVRLTAVLIHHSALKLALLYCGNYSSGSFVEWLLSVPKADLLTVRRTGSQLIKLLNARHELPSSILHDASSHILSCRGSDALLRLHRRRCLSSAIRILDVIL